MGLEDDPFLLGKVTFQGQTVKFLGGYLPQLRWQYGPNGSLQGTISVFIFKLVVGPTHFESYVRQIGSSPRVGVKNKK